MLPPSLSSAAQWAPPGPGKPSSPKSLHDLRVKKKQKIIVTIKQCRLSRLSLHLLTKLFHQLVHGGLPPPSEALLQNAPQHHPILAQDGVASLHLEQGINLKSWAPKYHLSGRGELVGPQLVCGADSSKALVYPCF